MRDLYETIDHAGLKIEIYPDHDDEGPDKWGDDNLFLVAFHRDFFVKREGFDKELVRDLLTDDGITEEYKETKKKYWVFPIEAYIHSGVAIDFASEGNFPDRRWDVSNPIGAIFVAKSEWRLSKKAREAAKGLIDTWNMSLSGDVWGYVVKDAEGEDLPGDLHDSCWGFYGLEYAIKEGKEAVEYIAKQIQKNKERKLKAYIKNKVPFAKRDLAI